MQTLINAQRLACVASVSSQGSSRKLGQEQKKKMNDGEGEGKEGTLLPLQPFFCFRSNFRLLRRLLNASLIGSNIQ